MRITLRENVIERSSTEEIDVRLRCSQGGKIFMHIFITFILSIFLVKKEIKLKGFSAYGILSDNFKYSYVNSER